MKKISILYVCLGNICRSPLAENITLKILKEEMNNNNISFEIDSCGTSGWHIGETPDSRMKIVAANHGIKMIGTARKFTANDLIKFDYIIAMDSSNLSNIKKIENISNNSKHNNIYLLRHFDIKEFKDHDVPDPYYGGNNGFENVYNICDRSIRNFLNHIMDE